MQKEKLGKGKPPGQVLDAGDVLWVADGSHLRKVDCATGNPISDYFVASSRNLGLLVSGPDGEVYAADATGFVFRCQEPRLSIFLLPGEVGIPDSLAVHDGKLWITGTQNVSVDLKSREKS